MKCKLCGNKMTKNEEWNAIRLNRDYCLRCRKEISDALRKEKEGQN